MRARVLTDGLEDLADEALGRPVGHAELATGAADADQFGGGLVVIGREHYAEGGNDGVEAGGCKGQGLGIGFLDFDLQSCGRGAFTGASQQRGHVVGGDHLAPAAGRGQRGIAVAGCDIKHFLVVPTTA
ncbi:hypothetical protein G6F50_016379 [Rhizopus delemar]|uniref:Uncharacterized protein n=1 Tax=Rhizopus delemar TaxID=936053 RepID=A0A9P7C1V7_9FUNG|nr:hypothetical protein G6F50_016379 [Rhizopus delemar]